jgi:hypothetical protein
MCTSLAELPVFFIVVMSFTSQSQSVCCHGGWSAVSVVVHVVMFSRSPALTSEQHMALFELALVSYVALIGLERQRMGRISSSPSTTSSACLPSVSTATYAHHNDWRTRDDDDPNNDNGLEPYFSICVFKFRKPPQLVGLANRVEVLKGLDSLHYHLNRPLGRI